MPKPRSPASTVLARWGGRFALSAGSVAMCIVALELGLRLVLRKPAPQAPPAAPRDNEWAFYQYDPLLGWRNRPGAEGTFSMADSRTRIRINSRGLRDVEHSLQKGTRFRVLVVGDSFTWGFGVEQGQRYTDRLQAALGSGVEVINAGVSGYGTDQELLFLQAEGLRYAPDLVLVAYGEEDVLNNNSSVQYSYPKPFYVVEHGRIQLHNVPVPVRATSWSERWRLQRQSEPARPSGVSILGVHLLSYDVVADRVGVLRRRVGPRRLDPLTGKLLLAMKSLVESRGANLVVLLVPYKDHILGHRTPRGWSALVGFLEHHGFLHVDLAPGLDRRAREGATLYFEVDAHWSPAGHAAVAEVLAGYLRARRLVPGPRPVPPEVAEKGHSR